MKTPSTLPAPSPLFSNSVQPLIYNLIHNEIWYIVFLLWFENTHTHKHTHTHTHTNTYIHTQRHTAHSGASRLIHPLIPPYKYIFKFTLLVMSFSSYLYYIEWLIHWYEKFTFHNVFSFKKFHPLYKGVVGGGGSNYVFIVLGPVLFYFSFAKWELPPD